MPFFIREKYHAENIRNTRAEISRRAADPVLKFPENMTPEFYRRDISVLRFEFLIFSFEILTSGIERKYFTAICNNSRRVNTL